LSLLTESLDTANEIEEEIGRSKMNVKKTISVCNRVDEAEMQKRIREVAKTTYGIEVAGFIPSDIEIASGELSNRNILHLPESPAYKATRALMAVLQGPSES
jgi:CO dehydrogenase nickel-insertion accessory protein CooC1